MRQYVASSSEYDEHPSTPETNVGNADFSICCHVRYQTIVNDSQLFSKGNFSGGSGGGVRYAVQINIGNIAFNIDDNSTKTLTGFSGSADTDYWFIFERDAGTTIKIFDGDNQLATVADGTGDIDVSTGLVLGAGRASGNPISTFSDVQIAEFAIIKRLLTTQEKIAFKNGLSPRFFGPSFYAPMVRGPNDVYGPPAIGLGGTPDVIPHRRVIYPSAQILQFPAPSLIPLTLIITLTGDTWVASGTTFDDQRQPILDGLSSDKSELHGWNAEIGNNEVLTAVVRTDDTTVTVTLTTAVSAYAITEDETITVTIPAAALVTSSDPVIATPTFDVTNEGAAGGRIMSSLAGYGGLAGLGGMAGRRGGLAG